MARYLCDTYDKSHRLLPALGDLKRYAVLQWVHASEATFMLHALAILYARWNQKSGDVEETEAGLQKNVQKDLEFFEAEVNKSGGPFLFGKEMTAADISMHFSIAFILARGLGTKGRSWGRLEQFVKDCESIQSYKQAVAKTGHKL
jgi:glutathione S-transferase